MKLKFLAKAAHTIEVNHTPMNLWCETNKYTVKKAT